MNISNHAETETARSALFLNVLSYELLNSDASAEVKIVACDHGRGEAAKTRWNETRGSLGGGGYPFFFLINYILLQNIRICFKIFV